MFNHARFFIANILIVDQQYGDLVTQHLIT